ncbi:MAG: triphosphoribosyl-dephospho-CoA synthase [Synergistaceae bacterium]|nr:triphosphoribosyl-dephospho-CoA synthase [Synergistaceae bacterium]
MMKMKNMKTTMTNRRIGDLALEAVLVEVSVTPKPGLVDRNNSGSHSDMDFFTFMKSAAALRSCFERCADAAGLFLFPRGILSDLRGIGLDTEEAMLKATGGINTHKGEIFSLGILSGCAGFLLAHGEPLEAENILNHAAAFCDGVIEHDFVHAKAKPPELRTKGERIWVACGIAGARGEARAGYPSVRNAGLPALTKYLADGMSINDALAFTLIHIMAVNYDTNIISRRDLDTAEEVMKTAENLIAEGLTLGKLSALDSEFISRNISPSGSADLLAVTYFIYALTHPSPSL